MNRAELRRLITVLGPVAVLVTVSVVVSATVLEATSRTAPGVDIGPRIGDHWHAAYQFYVCGEKQPNAPTWEGVGIHTHGDGIIHIHPFTPSEEGSGARLVKWFEYGGGELKDDEIQMPGSTKTYHNGDKCPDGAPGVLQISVNGLLLDDWSEYIPRDGDRVLITFGPPRP